MAIRTEINDQEVKKLLNGMEIRMEDQTELVREASIILKESVRQNFAEGGRPSKWARLKHRDGQALRDTNRLMNSITRRASRGKAYVGTNLVYAAVHHLGAKKGSFGQVMAQVGEHTRNRNGKKIRVQAHERKTMLPWGDIPARPFMLIQDEDRVTIEGISKKYIMGGKP